MSALAMILTKRGYSVSGSDNNKNSSLNKLKENGIRIFSRQSAENIHTLCKTENKVPVVVISTAIPKSNPELQASYEVNLKILHRSDVLAALINNQSSIVVAGSHGKTTTSTVITTLLGLCNEDPTAIIGGYVPIYKSNGHAGQGKYLVAEADESDGTLIKFNADLGIITNLELDHTNHYRNIEELTTIMKQFGNNSKKLIANYDCPKIKEHFHTNIIWWSTKNTVDVDYSAIPIEMNGKETIAKYYEKNKLVCEINLPLPGLHNLSNITGSIASCREAGIPFSSIKEKLQFIKAPNRRFEYQGIWKGRQIVDDYAHHPSEIEATITMARLMINKKQSMLPNQTKRLVVVFQPHRFSRTKDLMIDFAHSLGKADLLIVTPIYSAGEKPIQGVNHISLASSIRNFYPEIQVITSNDLQDLNKILTEQTFENDLILIMGAGDINTLSKTLI